MNTHMDRMAAEVAGLRKSGGGGGGGLPKEFAEQWEVRSFCPSDSESEAYNRLAQARHRTG
jgi:hypothetical protein